jgi:hypothetical protein
VSSPAHQDLATRWAEGLARSFGALGPLQSPTMRVWHSTDGQWVSREDADRHAAAVEAAGRPQFSHVRTLTTSSGFVLQATLGTAGGPTTHLVQIVTVEDGLVTCIEEYVAPERRRA